MSCHETQADRGNQSPDHGVSVAVLAKTENSWSTKQDQNFSGCKPAFCRYIDLGLIRVTIMRALVILLCLLSTDVAPAAEPPRLPVFDFEMLDTSLEGEMQGARADEQGRLIRAAEQLRKELG